MGMVLSVRWIHNEIVATGPYCTAQGIIQQFGELGVAVSILVRRLFLLMSWGPQLIHILPDARSPHIRICSVASRIKITPLCCWHGFPCIVFCYAVGKHWG